MLGSARAMVTSLSRKRIDVDEAVPASLMTLMSGNKGEFGSRRKEESSGRVWRITLVSKGWRR